MATLELYGTTAIGEMREWLEWKRTEFVEYGDLAARRRMREISGGQRTLPILVENGKVVAASSMNRQRT